MYFKQQLVFIGFVIAIMLSGTANAIVLSVSDYDPVSDPSGLSVISANDNSGSDISLSDVTQLTPSVLQGGVVYETVEFVDGYDYSVVRFDDLALGTYQLTLTDFKFPDAFSQLGASISTATQSIGSIVLSGGVVLQDSIIFDVTAYDSYYLSVFGRGLGANALGLYGIELKNLVSNVPLPASVVFLISGLLVIYMRKTRKFFLETK